MIKTIPIEDINNLVTIEVKIGSTNIVVPVYLAKNPTLDINRMEYVNIHNDIVIFRNTNLKESEKQNIAIVAFPLEYRNLKLTIEKHNAKPVKTKAQ